MILCPEVMNHSGFNFIIRIWGQFKENQRWSSKEEYSLNKEEWLVIERIWKYKEEQYRM